MGKHKDYSQDKGGSTVHGNIALLKLASKPDKTQYRSACLPELKKGKKNKNKKKKKKKKTMGGNKRQTIQELKLLGWRLNPFLPGALSEKLQERTVELGKCRGKINKRLCITAPSCDTDYGGPLIQVLTKQTQMSQISLAKQKQLPLPVTATMGVHLFRSRFHCCKTPGRVTIAVIVKDCMYDVCISASLYLCISVT